MCVFELLKRFCECKIEFGILGGFENWMCAKLSSNFDIAPRKFCLHCQVIYAKILGICVFVCVFKKYLVLLALPGDIC